MATVDCQELPPPLSSDKNQWSFDIPDSNRSEAEDDDDIIPMAPVITIDTHFKGLTVLRSFRKPLEHKIEYVSFYVWQIITWLTGKAALQSQDWQAMPSDLSKSEAARTYGFAIHSPVTFQSLE
jgi:hypothetical protein